MADFRRCFFALALIELYEAECSPPILFILIRGLFCPFCSVGGWEEVPERLWLLSLFFPELAEFLIETPPLYDFDLSFV